MITDWRQREVLAQISGQVLTGMDNACRFVAEQAEANAPRRTGRLSRDIAYEVKGEGKDIVGYVGVKKGGAFYGLFVERGTRRMRAQPFLRPALFNNLGTVARKIAGK